MRPSPSALPRSARATCRSTSPACRSSRRSITRRARSTNRRSIRRWVRGRTRSASSRSIATSNTSASRTGGPRICRSAAATSISTWSATNSIATATSPSRASPARTICSARSSPRASGRRATISPPSRTAASSASRCRTSRRPGAQGWFINTRRDKFRDPRVREALTNAFDFEWTNKTIMYGAYARTHSPFQNSDMMAEGPPSPEELKLLEPFRGQVPDEVFGEPYRAAGVRRLGAGPQDAAQGAATAQRRRLAIKDGKRLLPNGEVVPYRIPVRRALAQSAPRALHQESGHARHRGEPAPGRCRAIPRAGGRFRFRHDHHALLDVDDPWRFDASLLRLELPPRPRARTISPASKTRPSTR